MNEAQSWGRRRKKKAHVSAALMLTSKMGAILNPRGPFVLYLMVKLRSALTQGYQEFSTYSIGVNIWIFRHLLH